MSNFSPMPLSYSQCWWKRARCRGWWCPLSRNLKSRQFAAFTDSHSWLHFTFCVHCSDGTCSSSRRHIPSFFSGTQLGRCFWVSSRFASSLSLRCVEHSELNRGGNKTTVPVRFTHGVPTNSPCEQHALREAAVLWALPDEFGPVAEHHEQHSQHRDDIDELPHVGVQTEWSFLPNHRDWPTCLSVYLSACSLVATEYMSRLFSPRTDSFEVNDCSSSNAIG